MRIRPKISGITLSTFTSSKLTMETPESVGNLVNLNNKDTRTTLVSLFLTLTRLQNIDLVFPLLTLNKYFSRTLTIHRTAGEGRKPSLFLTTFSTGSQTLLDCYSMRFIHCRELAFDSTIIAF